MRSLKTIQKLSSLGSILSKIAFGFSGALCATRVCRFSEEKLGQMLSVEFQAMMLLVKSKAEDAS